MAVFKSDILQVAIPQVALLPSSVLWPSPSIIHGELWKAGAITWGSQKEYVILGQVATWCFKATELVSIFRFYSYSMSEMCICSTHGICNAFCSSLGLLFPHSRWSPGDDWRPQLTKQLPLASTAPGIHSPSDESQHVITIAKQQLARASPG